ncbi:MAG TPA: bacillithiol biosynthesis cysteine-adding enzyme BshC [Bacteroidota bacterium]|nr:bacillithiol biosynthesis cysteine-adding enzyme BshC [Bacteroidota bacterium]
MDWLDFRQLPPASGGFSELFFDYIDDFEKVARFFPGNFRDLASLPGIMERIDGRGIARDVLKAVLTEQNSGKGESPRTLENIRLLGSAGTYAVVTGQQVGLFGGPLYTLYKAITALLLAQKLSAKFPGKNFVPVFWLEGEDHDFAEMNHVAVLDHENLPVRIEYLPGGTMPERNVGAVGLMSFDETIAACWARLESTLTGTEFTPRLMESLRSCYARGATFAGAFQAWLNRLLPGSGLVFISSLEPRLKRILSPLFVRELEEYPRISQMVIDRSAELEQSYHAQVKPKSINLFLFHKGGRYLIEPRETDFSLKGTRAFFSREQLIAIARETPEQLSPNVVLRPLCQDMLLPTVAYVGGPSEIAYHAQLGPLYQELSLVQPLIYPRASVSLVQTNLLRAMEKYSLELPEFLGNVGGVTAKVVEQISDIKLDRLFAGVTTNLHEALGELKFGLNEIDPTLLGALENVTSKIDVNLGVLKEKAVAAQKRRNDTAVRQIEKAAAGLLPEGSLQERELSPLYYMNRYGEGLGTWLTDRIDIGAFRHQILQP